MHALFVWITHYCVRHFPLQSCDSIRQLAAIKLGIESKGNWRRLAKQTRQRCRNGYQGERDRASREWNESENLLFTSNNGQKMHRGVQVILIDERTESDRLNRKTNKMASRIPCSPSVLLLINSKFFCRACTSWELTSLGRKTRRTRKICVDAAKRLNSSSRSFESMKRAHD